MHSSEIEKDADKLDSKRVQLGVKVEEIIREQEAIMKASEKGIFQLNSDLKALKVRLEAYVGTAPKNRDELYFDLKGRYENKLKERFALESAYNVAAESITAARLHLIPGE